MHLKPTFLLFAAVGAILGAASSAHAFCRTMTGREPGDAQETNRCTNWKEQEQNACCPYGKPLFWRNACVGFSLQKNASRQVSLSDAERIFKRAFATWTATTCSLNGTPVGRVSMDVSYLGVVDCSLVEFNEEAPNQNVIMFRDSGWTHLDPNATLGLTTVTYNPNTGEISGADMEINAAQSKPLSVSDSPPAGSVDLLSIATHEAGHFLGFAHSTVSDATMYATYFGVGMRDLAPDDSTGICNVYKPDQNRTTGDGVVRADKCDPTPAHGYMSQCADHLSIEGGGCALASGSSRGSEPSPMPSPLTAALGALSLVLLRRVRHARGMRMHIDERR
ncbi:matrixin family metalloprotease [Pendulispora brunnea]|uniref:Matrixin family metalloprotease n=1 Tax=Pendulispora brunnea TaxID=2905690 RepID=A0ABZ2KCP9_9BACT